MLTCTNDVSQLSVWSGISSWACFISPLSSWHAWELKLILGHSWQCKHNPEIDWATGKVKMSRCLPHCCSGCREEAYQEWIMWKAEICWMEACSAGPMLELLADLNDKDLLVSPSGDLSEEVILEKGDHIFAVSLICLLWISKPLPPSLSAAEAFKLNSEASAPPWKLFQTTSKSLKVSSLRNPLTPYQNLSNGTMSSNWYLTKRPPLARFIYILALSEQKEFDQFLNTIFIFFCTPIFYLQVIYV